MAEALGMNVIYYDVLKLPRGNAKQVPEELLKSNIVLCTFRQTRRKMIDDELFR